MELRRDINLELWNAVESSYESENYAHAIIDAIHFLSDLIRAKSGLDSDGQKLVGEAFGGDTPLIRLNRLQTETEKNEQKGMEQLLRGMYMAIRNPRSHEQIQDNKNTADAIIFFTDYLLGVLGGSEEQFALDRFLARVIDPDFVRNVTYARLIVGEIPKNRKFDTLIYLYRKKTPNLAENFGLVIKEILQIVTDDQKQQFVNIVSDELKTVSDETLLRSNLQIMPPELWAQLSEVARVRIEHKIISSIQSGLSFGKQTIKGQGVLAVWARPFLPYFSTPYNVYSTLLNKIEDENPQSTHYAFHFFSDFLFVHIQERWIKIRFAEVMAKSILAGDKELAELLVNSYANEKWREVFRTVFQEKAPEMLSVIDRWDANDIPF